MKKLMAGSLLAAGALLAQPPQVAPQIVETRQLQVVNGVGGEAGFATAGKFAFISAEASFEATLVKGVPFTGDFVSENVQSLADGNRIKNSNTTSYARDGEGRTRREITINAIGPLTGDTARKTIFIHDAVANTDYILDPQEKTVRKIVLGNTTAGMPPAGFSRPVPDGAVFHRVEGPKDVIMEHRGTTTAVPAQRMPLPPGIVLHGEGGAGIGQRMMTFDAASSASNANFKNEPLGKRIIEGVEAEGTRTTLTIPAGQIGNDLPLDTVSERWYSNELKTVVLTKRTDPRSGENTYKLTNLRRGEPSRSLFEVPSDYRIVTEDHVGPGVMRMKIEKRDE